MAVSFTIYWHITIFLGIEVERFKKGIYLSKRTYVFDVLSATYMLGCKTVDAPMDMNFKPMHDPRRYRRLVKN